MDIKQDLYKQMGSLIREQNENTMSVLLIKSSLKDTSKRINIYRFMKK